MKRGEHKELDELNDDRWRRFCHENFQFPTRCVLNFPFLNRIRWLESERNSMSKPQEMVMNFLITLQSNHKFGGFEDAF